MSGPPYHGRTHKPGGSDYAGGVYMDAYNGYPDGDFFSLQAANNIDLQGGAIGVTATDTNGMFFSAGAVDNVGITLNVTNSVTNTGIQLNTSGGSGGIQIYDQDDGSGVGIFMQSVSGPIELYTVDRNITLDSQGGGDVEIFATGDSGGSINLSAHPGSNTPNGMMLASTHRLNIRAQGSELGIASEGSRILLRVWPGYGVSMMDQDSSTTLFRIDYNGDVHMKTGATIVYDL